MTVRADLSPLVSGDSIRLAFNAGLELSGQIVFGLFRTSSKTGAFYGDPVVLKQATIVDGPAGEFEVELVPEDTADLAGTFYYETEARLSGGAVVTTHIGTIKIVRDAIV